MPDANLPMHIRLMIRCDTPGVLEIEWLGLVDGWTMEEFLAVMRKRNVIGMTARVGETIVGYFIYELFPRRIDVLRFAVHPDHRRRGVGSRMIAKLIGKLSTVRRTQLRFHVRERNLDAQLFLRSRGLRGVWVEREHFDDTGEDAFLMTYTVPSGEVARA